MLIDSATKTNPPAKLAIQSVGRLDRWSPVAIYARQQTVAYEISEKKHFPINTTDMFIPF